MFEMIRDLLRRTRSAASGAAGLNFRRLIEHSDQVFWLTDLRRATVVYVSPSFESLFGQSRERLRADPRAWTRDIHQDDREMIEGGAARFADGGSPAEVEYRLIRPDGSIVWVRQRFIPIEDARGRSVRRLAIAEDVTDRKRTELRRVELEEQLIQSEKVRAVGQLVGGVAHDFNNVLTTILGHVDLARVEAQTRVADVDVLLARLGEIRESAELAADVVRQLLAFSRQQVAQPRPISLNDVIRGSERMLRRLIPESVTLRIEAAPDLRGIRADSGQIKQILLNLVVNARDAMPGGGTVTLATRNVDLADPSSAARAGVSPGAYALLEVRDTGSGMDEATLRHAFEPFFTTKAMGLGTGLGLATVHGIVKQSGGSVAIESESGTGTTIRIYFPALDRVPESRPDAARLGAPAPGGTETVLLCEDDLLVRPLVARMLKNAGYRVLTAENGAAALDAAARFEGLVHLLITDVVMPDMDGKALADALTSQRPGIEVLYVSGYTSDVIAHHGVMDEGVHLLEKPFTSAELLCAVRRLLDRRYGANTAGDPVLLPCVWRGGSWSHRRRHTADDGVRFR
ncbi:MAG: response regulator [Phycisphaerales bacterium]|nr:MAG: response regulator [Phycisphaerales bacterium]